jgi:hypothetical protein
MRKHEDVGEWCTLANIISGHEFSASRSGCISPGKILPFSIEWDVRYDPQPDRAVLRRDKFPTTAGNWTTIGRISSL